MARHYIRDDILRAAAEVGREVREMDAADAKKFWVDIASKFARRNVSMFLWEHLRHSVTVRDENGWLRIGDYVGQQQAILFFNPGDETTMFLLQNGEHLTSVLGNSHGHEFYVSDLEQSYLLLFNHHDLLMAAGPAAEWLKQIYADYYERVT